MHQSRFFDHLEATRLPQLQSLSLVNIECQGDVLAAFAATHSATLRRVSLDQITLYSGEFQPFFNCLQSEMPHLEAYNFANLHEGKKRICFLVPGTPNVPSTDLSDGLNRLQREGQDVQSRIQYRLQQGGSIGCPELFRSLVSSVQKYGPPMAYYSFLASNKTDRRRVEVYFVSECSNSISIVQHDLKLPTHYRRGQPGANSSRPPTILSIASIQKDPPAGSSVKYSLMPAGGKFESSAMPHEGGGTRH